MNLRAVLAGLVLLVASMVYAEETPPGMTPTPTPSPTPTPTPTPKPVVKKGPTPTPKKKEDPKIDGMTLTRANGNFIGFNFVGNNIVLTFYDAKKKKMPADVDSAVVRWEMKRKTGDDRATFSRGGDPATLVSAKTVPPPHSIRFTVLFFKDGSDQALETYVVTPSG